MISRGWSVMSVSAALALAGCAGGYRQLHPRLAAELVDVGAPAMPAPDALPACGPEEALVDRVTEAGAYASLRRACVDRDGRTRGLVFRGHVGRQRDELRVSWGVGEDGIASFEGRWTVVNGREWWTGEVRGGRPIGQVHGVRQGQRFSVRYDDAGLPDGTWDTPFGRADFDHGTGDVAWSFGPTTRTTSHCRDGLADGVTRTETEREVREESHAGGRREGPYRVLDRDGSVVSEGLVRDGVWVQFRGPVEGRCVEEIRRKGSKVVVNTECVRWVDPFVVRASCTSPTECSYERETTEGLVPLGADGQGLVALPSLAENVGCVDPFLGWYWQGVW